MAATPLPPTRSTGLGPGERLPDFARTAADGRVLYFYEFANGRPLLFAACGGASDKGEVDTLIGAVRALATDIGAQAVVLCGEGVDGAASDLDVAVLVDPDPQLRDYVFGTAEGRGLAAFAIADPNLRVIARSALAASAPATSLAAALRVAAIDALARWQAERDALGGLAPVLLVPRVLPPDLCRRLIAGFPDWLPRDSPMPDAAQPALAVDLARKRRFDALIGDPTVESETVAAIAASVVPEIAKAFCFEAVRFERLKIVCYRAGDGGHFATHRDNTAPQTAHRRFALTVNLNTGEYQGGTLAFPEYGEGHGYAVPAGGAIVFACTHAHRVDPVTAGERYALISFLSGA